MKHSVFISSGFIHFIDNTYFYNTTTLPCPLITNHTTHLPNIKQGESESQLSSLSLISFGEILQLATIIYILPTFAHFYQANISFTCCQIPGEIVKYLYFIATDKSNQQLLYLFQYLVFQKWFLMLLFVDIFSPSDKIIYYISF